MAPKVNKGKCVASSSHGSKTTRRTSEEEHEDVGMALLWAPLSHGEIRGIDVTKTQEPKGINGPVLSVNERNVRIDNMLSHLVGPGFKEPFDDDVATKDEMARVDTDIESSDDNEEDSEMVEAAFVPTDDE
ncbi:hypothetical protein HAX54_013736 [Datura stramonium]|uniref:Uncharacterized protein n=1 Tax=Datura stramonium TaxID=4076 RepID=A0ABS8TNI3_DATST|nr:hypothetical protein [Datura stramonium]